MGINKPIEQNLLNYQGTIMYLKNIIRVRFVYECKTDFRFY